ncbi:hypothetical protein EXIGLDRAFT_694907 [Exidia glandulosa HHB12029]|uniref:Uncharacterized protein n=1 Tax=Exidia glandulosa HHB12029 TaxID=1314781 RepID=A0A165GAP6_EXIGL|nr:hypothetical protein EXIGLDRAFT_694907 [Exidia glandulosa HHB12029]
MSNLLKETIALAEHLANVHIAMKAQLGEVEMHDHQPTDGIQILQVWDGVARARRIVDKVDKSVVLPKPEGRRRTGTGGKLEHSARVTFEDGAFREIAPNAFAYVQPTVAAPFMIPGHLLQKISDGPMLRAREDGEVGYKYVGDIMAKEGASKKHVFANGTLGRFPVQTTHPNAAALGTSDDETVPPVITAVTALQVLVASLISFSSSGLAE